MAMAVAERVRGRARGEIEPVGTLLPGQRHVDAGMLVVAALPPGDALPAARADSRTKTVVAAA